MVPASGHTPPSQPAELIIGEVNPDIAGQEGVNTLDFSVDLSGDVPIRSVALFGRA
jgi:hypothetical protein